LSGVATAAGAGRLPPRGALRDWLEIARPFSLTASAVPVLVGSAVGWWSGRGNAAAFLVALVGALLLQVGTNMVNEVFDVARGVDTLATPRASRTLVEGRLAPTAAYRAGLGCLLGGAAVGAWLAWGFRLGPAPFLLGLLGAAAGYAYTAPPLAYKYRALGTPLVFVLMGPLMVLGAAYVQSGRFTAGGLVASLPVGLLVAAILHGNELRDVAADRAAGTRTLPALLGWVPARRLYVLLLSGSYLVVVLGVLGGVLPVPALLPVVSLPLAAAAVARVRGAPAVEADRRLARLDQQTALVHLAYGVLLAAGLAMAAAR
jgi:1,4-dihydroxy-2-naphthoate octaprenyltransferase